MAPSTAGEESKAAPGAPPAGAPAATKVVRRKSPKKLPEGVSPEESSNLFSYLFFVYLGPLLSLAQKRTLTTADLWPLHSSDNPGRLKKVFVEAWAHQKTLPKPSLLKAVLKVMGWRVYLMALMEAIFRSMGIVSPILLEKMIIWVADKDAPDDEGYIIAALLFVGPFIAAMCTTHNYHLATRAWQHARVAISMVVFEKALSVSGFSAVKGSNSGKTLQLMETDAERIGQIVLGFNQAWLVPIQIAVIIFLLAETIGVAAVAGLAVMLVMLPLMAIVFVVVLKMEAVRVAIAGDRVKLQGEVLHGIRVVKFYAWEKAFMERMFAFRKKETTLLLKMNFVKSTIVMMFMLLPLLVGLASFGTFMALDNALTAPVVFKALALFNALRFPLIALPSSAQTIVTGLVSLARVQSFLDRDNLEKTTPCPGQTEEVPAMIKDGTFRWDRPAEPEAGANAEQASGKGEDATNTSAGAAAGAGTGAGAGPVSTADVDVSGDNAERGQSDVAQLRNINFQARRGTLTAVVGSVGSGKSSLLSCLLGEMHADSGCAHISANRIGFVAQSAWIQNLSLRDNILFGEEYDAERYHRVVDACALRDDLDILPQDDQTEIGDRGINLSGGQKQRVALARAVYARPEVLLFDDPLSAVDANVGEHIFNKCINGSITQGATRILVTNQLHLLPQCDFIYVMKDGEVAEEGTYATLMAAGGELPSLVRQSEQEAAKDEAEGDESGDEVVDDTTAVDPESGVTTALGAGEEGLRARSRSNASADGIARELSVSRPRSRTRTRTRSRGVSGGRVRTKSQIAAEAGNIVEEEESEEGAVALSVYWHHFKMMGGMKMLLTMTFFVVITQLAIIASDYWLAYWTNDELPLADGPQNKSDGFYLGCYAGLIGVAGIALLGRGVVFAYGGYSASRNHHRAVVKGVLEAPSTFFDRTPTGRILNRFLKDTNSVDSVMPTLLENGWSVFAILIGNLAAVAAATPLFLIPLVIIIATLFAIQRYYKAGALAMQRIEAVTRSPVVSHFTEVLNGSSTIRAFRAAERFKQENCDRIMLNSQTFWMMRLTFRWAVTRIEILNAFSSFFAALFIALAKDDLQPAFAGAALNFALSSGGIIGFSVILATDLEIRMNAVERLRHYGYNLAKEKPWDIEGSVPKNWPSEGRITFEDVSMKYRASLEPALRHFDAEINSKETVGVAGRTGSGKSTLMLTLFRMYELSNGRIKIDDVDISKVGLHQLRKRLAIIPQDPVLFSGTVRDNLDPFNDFQDDELKETLARCQLADAILVKKQGLETPVTEYGKNFSQGEAQLLCMGRALLRKPKILVMDEATSSVDARTDRILQQMITENFADCTVIAIAHRLNTILGADRVLVLDSGTKREFDTPVNLVRTEGGIFSAMATAHGIRWDPQTGTLVYDEEHAQHQDDAGNGASDGARVGKVPVDE